MNSSIEQTVLTEAAALVNDFAGGVSAEYFRHFASDAKFVFYTHPKRLESRDEYEHLWQSWQTEDGFQVLSCRSTNTHVQLVHDDVAVFSHDVETQVSTRSGGVETLHEQETIVFARDDEKWVAIHEHLSPASAQPGD